MWRPTAEDLIEINRREVGEGSLLRDRHLLEGAVERPWQSAGGTDAYPSMHLKAAALMDSVSNTQPFVDGNKRTALLAVRLLYAFEGLDFMVPLNEGYDISMYVAEQRPVDLEFVAMTLSAHCTPIPSDD